jgi:hypothetical protein
MKRDKKPQEQFEEIVKEAQVKWDTHQEACRTIYPSEILNNYPVKSKLIVEIAIDSIRGIIKSYCDGAFFNGQELKAAISVASKIRIVWSNEGLMLPEVPLAKNLDWPDKQDFFRLEQWFLSALAAMAKIDSLEGITYFPKDEESLEANAETVDFKPLNPKHFSDCPNFRLLSKIDRDPKGIDGDSETLKRLREYLTRKAKNIETTQPNKMVKTMRLMAKKLYIEDGKIKTHLPRMSMFSE